MTGTTTWHGLAAVAALTLAAAAPGQAQVIDLEGETVTIVHNASPGGATGLGAQVAADAWAKTMAGNPNIVVQSVAGGALTQGIQHVMNARPDGETIGWLAWQGSTRILDPEELQIPFEDFGLIGGVGGANFFFHVDTKAGGGIETAEDVAEVDALSFGGFSAKSAASLQSAAALDMLGVDWNFISGFAGDGPLWAAMARGEIDSYPATAVIYGQQMRDGPIADGESVAAWHYGPPTDDGAGMVPDEAFDGEVPTFADYYVAATGNQPSGPEWDMIQFHGRVSNPVNWIVVAPPETPAEHLQMLRESFQQAMTSPEFLEQAVQVFGTLPNVVYADEMTDIVGEVKGTPEDLKETMRSYISRMEG